MRLEGKVAIVAGVGPDIGKASALAFAREGAAVVLVARTRERLEAIAREIEAAGGRALVAPADITDERQVIAMVQRVRESFGRIDVLMNNATFSGRVAPLQDLSVAEWDQVLRGALTSYMMTTREALKVMIPQRSGSIIQVSSGAGVVGFNRRAHYAAAKAGVNNMVHTLAWEAGRYNIRVNGIVVGAVRTEAWGQGAAERARQSGMTMEQLEARWAERSPLRRMVRAREVADTALFLASEESSGLTGQLLSVTAGVVQ
jgi:3-oxoacyl-[acyl-carrier protein] reductase